MNLKKIKYFVIILLGVLSVFSSCSKDYADCGNGEIKELTIKAYVGASQSTRTAGASATGVTAELHDLKLYFTNGTNVLSIQDADPTVITSASGETFKVPAGVTQIYAIGNTLALGNASLLPTTVGGTIADVKATAIKMDEQSDTETGVNLKGESATFTVDSKNITLDIAPVTSRLEVVSVNSSNAVKVPLTSYKLTGIYINNTYTEFALNETTLPSGSAVVNYGKDVAAWTDGSYITFFKDEDSAGLGGNGVEKKLSNSEVWGYFTPATIANENPLVATKPGTIIDGVQQNAVPHVILKIEDVVTESGVIMSGTYYVTIKGYKNGSIPVTNLSAGNIYSMVVDFGAEHLSTSPEDPNKSLTVKVTIKPWNTINVTPEL